jgi:hypothetical protein
VAGSTLGCIIVARQPFYALFSLLKKISADEDISNSSSFSKSLPSLPYTVLIYFKVKQDISGIHCYFMPKNPHRPPRKTNF